MNIDDVASLTGPPPPSKRAPASQPRRIDRGLLYFVALPALAFFALVGFAALTGRLHVVALPDPSTAYRPKAYTPAIEVRPNVFHGTHFMAQIPQAWETYPADRLPLGDELVAKQPPVGQPNPVIIVTASDEPPGLVLEAYVDILRSRALDGHEYRTAGSPHSLSVAGSPAQEYDWTEPNGTRGVAIYTFKRGVAFGIVAGTPPHSSEAPFQRNLRGFLRSWRWVDAG